jgi:hypothetical protein
MFTSDLKSSKFWTLLFNVVQDTTNQAKATKAATTVAGAVMY